MKTSFQFIILMLLLSSSLTNCKNPSPEPINPQRQIVTYDLKELPEKTTIKLSDLGAIDIKYIPLETRQQSVIKGIDKLIFSKNFFLTHYYTDITMFRYDGTFISKIGTIGRGPNEFSVAHCLDVNPRNETIYLIDGWQQTFFVFSKNGQFIRTFKYPFRAAVDFRFTEDAILCYNKNNMGDTKTSFVLIDTTGQIIKSFPNKYPWTRNFPSLAFDRENVFYRYGSNLISKEMYCDTLYAFMNKNFEPYSIINTNEELRISPKVRSETDVITMINNYINPGKLFEFNEYLYYGFGWPINGKTEALSLIESKDGKVRILIDPDQDLINDIDGGPFFMQQAVMNDTTIVSWIDALDLKTFVSSETFKNSNPKYPNKKIELEVLAKSLKDTDNPVLILIKFK